MQEGEEISKGEGEGEEEEGEGEEQQEVEVDVDVDADVTESDDTVVTSLQEQNGEDADDDLELPPPMKPITESILVATANGPSGSTIPSELPGKRVSIRASYSLGELRFDRISFISYLDIHLLFCILIASFNIVCQSVGTYKDSRWRRRHNGRSFGDRADRQRENGK